MSIHYSERVDAVIYGSPITADYTREDWLRLAYACLDQAGLPGDALKIPAPAWRNALEYAQSMDAADTAQAEAFCSLCLSTHAVGAEHGR